MATCYICGKSHAEYRRTVNTGTSNRAGVTSRGRSSYSTTVHYGMRTVCANCALNIDYNNKKQSAGFAACLSLGIIGFFCVSCDMFVHFLPNKGSITLTLGSAVLFIVAIVCKSQKKKEADKWYEKNKNNYIDSADIRAERELKLKRAKEIQKQIKQLEAEKSALEKQKVVSQQVEDMGNVFSEILTSEFNILETKKNMFNETFGDIEVNTVEECNEILRQLKDYEKDLNATETKVNKICDIYIKQCRALYPSASENDFENAKLGIEKSRTMLLNYINAFMTTGVRNGENQILQAIIELQKSEEDN